eukprot:2450590-Prymnesium_polylepis.2
MVLTAEEQRRKRAATAAKEGRTLRSYKRKAADSSTPDNPPLPVPSTTTTVPPAPSPQVSSALPGGFCVGDKLVYEGRTVLVTVEGRPMRVTCGMRCNVAGVAKVDSMREIAMLEPS